MFPRSRTLIAISAFLLTAALVSGANAADHRYRVHRIKHVSIRHLTIRNAVRVIDRGVAVNADRNRPPHRRPGDVNTYSGDIAVYSRSGVGSWSYGTANTPTDLAETNLTVKVIDLSKGGNDCSMEHGVCVIRP